MWWQGSNLDWSCVKQFPSLPCYLSSPPVLLFLLFPCVSFTLALYACLSLSDVQDNPRQIPSRLWPRSYISRVLLVDYTLSTLPRRKSFPRTQEMWDGTVEPFQAWNYQQRGPRVRRQVLFEVENRRTFPKPAGERNLKESGRSWEKMFRELGDLYLLLIGGWGDFASSDISVLLWTEEAWRCCFNLWCQGWTWSPLAPASSHRLAI